MKIKLSCQYFDYEGHNPCQTRYFVYFLDICRHGREAVRQRALEVQNRSGKGRHLHRPAQHVIDFREQGFFYHFYF